MNVQSRRLMAVPTTRLGIPLAIFFAVTAEMAPAGAVRYISDGFGVDISTAALGTAIYATATALTAIPLSYALQGARLRRAFIFAGCCFAIANLCVALAPNLLSYLIFRGLNGIIHGAFFPLALALAAGSSEMRSERGVAEALLGNAFALAVGVPIGESLSETSWRITFVATAIGMLLSIFHVPKTIESLQSEKVFGSVSVSILPVILIGALFAGALAGHFSFYTFLSPHIEMIGVSTSLILAIYGIAVIFGTWVSGRLATRARLYRTALVLAVEAVALGPIIYFENLIIISVIVVVAGVCFGLLPTLVQSEMLSRSRNHHTIASGVAVVAFNSGIAGGAFLGGLAARHSSQAPIGLASTAIALSSFLFFLAGVFLHRIDMNITQK